MITATMTGNLGNHMWNYVLCRIVAEKIGYEWGVNPVPTHDYHNGSNQMYFMNVDFGKEVEVIGKNEKGLNVYKNIPNEYYDAVKRYNYNGNECWINMYDPNVFNIQDNTMVHLISQSEDYLIERKSEIQSWFNIKDEYIKEYENRLLESGIKLDENLCVINFRGGEFLSVHNLVPRPEYWRDCINHMKSINPNMNFIIITDDVNSATRYIGNYPCHHFDIGMDFYIINQSKYSILSNSSFGWWASWLNTNSNLIIGPKYWARHNVSDGYWSLGDQYVRGWYYMDRDGKLSDYDTCKKEAEEYYKNKNLI